MKLFGKNLRKSFGNSKKYCTFALAFKDNNQQSTLEIKAMT